MLVGLGGLLCTLMKYSSVCCDTLGQPTICITFLIVVCKHQFLLTSLNVVLVAY